MKASWLVHILFIVAITPAQAEYKWRDYRTSQNIEDRRLAGTLSELELMFQKWHNVCEGLQNSSQRMLQLTERAIVKDNALARTDIKPLRKDVFLVGKSCGERLKEALAQYKKIERIQAVSTASALAFSADANLDASGSQQAAARLFSRHEQNLSVQVKALLDFQAIIETRNYPSPSAKKELKEYLRRLEVRSENIAPLQSATAEQEVSTIKMRLTEFHGIGKPRLTFRSISAKNGTTNHSPDKPFKQVEDYREVLEQLAEIINADLQQTEDTLGKLRGMKAGTLKNEEGLGILK